jgi:nucleotide-binding universal stress UspA family protein
MTNDTQEADRRIVVGVDGSDSSKKALRLAADLAEAFGARLHALAIWQYPAEYGWAVPPAAWDPRETMAEILSQTIDAAFGGRPPAGLVSRVLEGGAARVLLDESEGAFMLVVGSRGHGGFAGLLLGSVSSNVAEHATCPVVIAHGV